LRTYYERDTGWVGSDYILQYINIPEIKPLKPIAPTDWSWKLIDKTAIAIKAIKQLTLPKDLDNPQKLDIATNLLIVQLQSIADFAIPKKKAIY
jgi:hypothetical protein